MSKVSYKVQCGQSMVQYESSFEYESRERIEGLTRLVTEMEVRRLNRDIDTTGEWIMSELDWSKAPEDSTHYCHARKDWLNYHVDSIDDCCVHRPSKKAQEVEHCTLSDDHPIRRIGELGNQLHNLGCELQSNEGLSDELGQIACCLWDIEKRERDRTKKQRLREELANLVDENYGNSGAGIADAILSRYNLEEK